MILIISEDEHDVSSYGVVCIALQPNKTYSLAVYECSLYSHLVLLVQVIGQFSPSVKNQHQLQILHPFEYKSVLPASTSVVDLLSFFIYSPLYPQQTITPYIKNKNSVLSC